MTEIHRPNVQETLAILQQQVDRGMGLYAALDPTAELVPQSRSANLHDKITGVLLPEDTVSLSDDPQYAIFKATRVEPFRTERSAPGYDRTLSVSVTWADQDPERPEFHGFAYGASDELERRVAERDAMGEVSWVAWAPKDGSEFRAGVPDRVFRRIVRPAGWIAVSGDCFQGAVGPYVPYAERQNPTAK